MMPRIRTIKPEFWRHEEMQELECLRPDLKPMLVYAGLWTQADKNGIFEWKPKQLKLDILPFIPFSMAEVLLFLVGHGFLRAYDLEGKRYGFIPTFKEHQRITGKEQAAPGRYPEPVGDVWVDFEAERIISSEISGCSLDYVREVSGADQGNTGEVSGTYPGSIREVSGDFNEPLKTKGEVSGKYPGSIRRF
jgi:hypothetical protein